MMMISIDIITILLEILPPYEVLNLCATSRYFKTTVKSIKIHVDNMLYSYKMFNCLNLDVINKLRIPSPRNFFQNINVEDLKLLMPIFTTCIGELSTSHDVLISLIRILGPNGFKLTTFTSLVIFYNSVSLCLCVCVFHFTHFCFFFVFAGVCKVNQRS